MTTAFATSAVNVAVASAMIGIRGPQGPTGAAPPDAVIAFSYRFGVDDITKQYSIGYSPFEEARGRFIIGAGRPSRIYFEKWTSITSGIATDLALHKPFEAEGEKKHMTQLAEMLKRNHETALRADASSVEFAFGRTTQTAV